MQGDAVSDYLLGGDAGQGSAEMINLDQFTTTAAEATAARLGSEDGGEAPEPIVTYDDDSRGERSLTLMFPPLVDGERLTVIRLRLPEQKDIDDWGNGVLTSNRAFLSRLSGVHPAVLKRLKWPDAAALHALFQDLVPEFVTGE